jgi:hypothetical protein
MRNQFAKHLFRDFIMTGMQGLLISLEFDCKTL